MKLNGFKSHALSIVAVSIAILHLIITSIVGHYIAIQIGSSTGQLVAEGLKEATESPKSSEKDANKIYQDMKNKSNEIISRWKIPLVLISLPLKPVISPLINKVRKTWVYDPVLYRKISKEQFKMRGIIIENITNGLNSLTFGLLIYLALKLFLKKNRD